MSNQEILEAAKKILASYSSRVTLRQLYYRLVAAHVVENSLRSYKRLVAMLTKARKDHSLDPALFRDLTRESKRPYGYSDLPSFLRAVKNSYQRDRWQDQDHYVEIWVEKEALATVFLPICSRWQVRLVVCRGYASVSALYEAAGRFHDANEDGKHVQLIYFGDYDPSGVDIPRSVGDELHEWISRYGDYEPPLPDRVALLPEQIEEYDLPPVPPKDTDSRTASFRAVHGEDTVELDALPPNVLEEIIETNIRQYIDFLRWDLQGTIEDGEQAKLVQMIEDITE